MRQIIQLSVLVWIMVLIGSVPTMIHELEASTKEDCKTSNIFRFWINVFEIRFVQGGG